MKLAQAKKSRPGPSASGKPAAPGRPKSFLLGYPMVVALLVVHWLLAVSSVYDKSATFDETAHLTGGYSYWLTGDYRLNYESGVLAQRLAAIPLWLGRFEFPTEFTDSAKLQKAQAAWNAGDHWTLGQLFFYQSDNDPRQMLLLARAFMALVSVAMGLLVYFWSRTLFGPAGGVFSLALYSFSPAILGNGPLATTDLTSALCFLLAIGSFWRMLHVLSAWRVLACGLSLGLLFLSKMSAPVVLPFMAVLLVLRIGKGKPLELAAPGVRKALAGRLGMSAALAAAVALNAVMVLAIIWSAYSWRYSTFANPVAEKNTVYANFSLDEPGLTYAAGRFLCQRRLLPEAYVRGALYTVKTTQRRNAFLNGESYTDGRVAFFPYAFAVKTPLSALLALVLAVPAALRWRAGKKGSPPPEQVRDILYRTSPLWVLMIGYWAVALASHINIGLRHLLPAYGPMLILAGICGTWLESKARSLGWLAKGVLAAALLECALAWPNYLAYFNVFAGGTANGYKHLVDSSLDWGQDLPLLREWLLNNRAAMERQPVYLSYFGTSSPTWYGLTWDDSAARIKPVIHARRLPGMFNRDIEGQPLDLWPLTGGTYCVSATMLQGKFSSAPSPWVFSLEQDYQQSRELIRNLLKLPEEEIHQALRQNPQYWRPVCEGYVRLRMGRLCAYLRQRANAANIGGSILVYNLSDADVREAMDGPPAELLDDSTSPFLGQPEQPHR